MSVPVAVPDPVYVTQKRASTNPFSDGKKNAMAFAACSSLSWSGSTGASTLTAVPVNVPAAWFTAMADSIVLPVVERSGVR